MRIKLCFLITIALLKKFCQNEDANEVTKEKVDNEISYELQEKLGKISADKKTMIDEKIKKYVKLLEKKRDIIDKFLDENYSDFNHSEITAEDYVSHPINAYMLLKRMSLETHL